MRTKGNEGNVINSLDRQPRIPYHHRPPLAPFLLCARRYLWHSSTAGVNYGEAGFHKFWDEIWSDKFNSQDPAPWSRWAQVTRVDAHKYVWSRTRGLSTSNIMRGLRSDFRLSFVCRFPAAIDALPVRAMPIRMQILSFLKRSKNVDFQESIE